MFTASVKSKRHLVPQDDAGKQKKAVDPFPVGGVQLVCQVH